MIEIELYKTKIGLSSYICTIGDEITITVAVTDYNDNPITNKPITISSNNGYFHTYNNNTINGTSATEWVGVTNSNGQFTLTFIPTSNGTTVFNTRDTSANLIVSNGTVIPNPSTTIPSTETQNGAVGTSITYAKGDHSHPRNSWISYGQVDSTSTSTVFTATVPNLTELTDGTIVMLRNGVVNSATGFTLNVNNLGAKTVYSSMHNATADTTIFKADYTMLFVYDSTRITNGCWICYRGYNTNDNTLGYQIRTNSTKFTATDKGYRYRIWLETTDGKYMPVNTSSSTNATANRSTAMNTREFWLGGKILYNSTDGTTNANAQMSATTLWQQYPFNLGYSFNNTGSALTLTSNEPLYMVAENRGNGKARLTSPYYTQTLPSSEDNKLYIYLGHMYSATNLELTLDHPVYEYKNGGIRLYRDYYTQSEIDSKINNISEGIDLKAQMLSMDNWTSGTCSINNGTITFNDSDEFINDVNNNSVVTPQTFRLEFDVIFDDDYSYGDFIVCGCTNDFYATDTPHHFIIDIENNNGTVQCIESGDNWTISNWTQVLESNPFIMIKATPQQDGIQITNIKYSANNIQTLYTNQKNTSPINVTVTYTDSTTETIKLLKIDE